MTHYKTVRFIILSVLVGISTVRTRDIHFLGLFFVILIWETKNGRLLFMIKQIPGFFCVVSFIQSTDSSILLLTFQGKQGNDMESKKNLRGLQQVEGLNGADSSYVSDGNEVFLDEKIRQLKQGKYNKNAKNGKPNKGNKKGKIAKRSHQNQRPDQHDNGEKITIAVKAEGPNGTQEVVVVDQDDAQHAKTGNKMRKGGKHNKHQKQGKKRKNRAHHNDEHDAQHAMTGNKVRKGGKHGKHQKHGKRGKNRAHRNTQHAKTGNKVRKGGKKNKNGKNGKRGKDLK